LAAASPAPLRSSVAFKVNSAANSGNDATDAVASTPPLSTGHSPHIHEGGGNDGVASVESPADVLATRVFDRLPSRDTGYFGAGRLSSLAPSILLTENQGRAQIMHYLGLSCLQFP
jgi:hypothetical protein